MLSWLALSTTGLATVLVYGDFCRFYCCLSGGHLCRQFYKCCDGRMTWRLCNIHNIKE